MKKICEYCGREFETKWVRQKFCNGTHTTKCIICGSEFEFDITKSKIPDCCSKKCSKEKRRRTSIERYGTDIPSKSRSVRKKLSESGFAAQEKIKKTNLERYGVEHASQHPSIRSRISNTLRTDEYKEKYRRTCNERYGVDHPMQNRGVFEKHASSRKSVNSDGDVMDSSYEVSVYEFCKRNGLDVDRSIPIEYEYEGKKHITYIDFCIEGYLFEVKGDHLMNDAYKDIPVPIDVKLDLYRKNHVIVITDDASSDVFGKPNSYESNGLKYKDKCEYPLIGVDIDLFTENPTFPYRYDRPELFYDVKVSGDRSSKEAFYDESIRWRMILNRIQYTGGFIDGNQILTALNVTRTCKQPSWFSKSFARRLIDNYASTDIIVDPFAGWGARHDASIESGRHYIGSDFNKDLVDWHVSEGRTIGYADAKQFKYDGKCSVLICPPYQDIEVYFEDQDSSLTQCEWLSIVMDNVPNASEYIMVCKVVDPGWEKHIVDVKENKSHFGSNKEYVIVVNNDSAADYNYDDEYIEELRNREKVFLEKRRIRQYEDRKNREKRRWMYNEATSESKQVPVSLVESYNTIGWVEGRNDLPDFSNMVWVNDGVKEYRVHESDINEDIYSIGRLANTTKGRKLINNGTSSKYVETDELESYISDGWSIGEADSSNRSGKTAIFNITDGSSKFVKNYKVQHYIDSGNWVLGNGRSGRVWITNGSSNKNVEPEKVQEYLDSGWRIGKTQRSVKSTVWVNDGKTRKRVKPDELDHYLSIGFKIGKKLEDVTD